MQVEGYSMAQLTVLKDMSVLFAMGTLQGNTSASVAVIDFDRAIT
jgi:hypothetical protein